MMQHCKLLILSLVLITACQSASSALPAEDVSAIRTQAVQTAVMEITVQAVLHPSVPASQIPVEETALPAAPVEPIITTSPLTESFNVEPNNLSVNSVPPDAAQPLDVYQCEFVSQSPLDKPQAAGANYDVVWTIRNTGVATWNTREYQIKWLGGSDLSPCRQYALPGNIAPSESVEIIVDIKIPPNPSDDMLLTRWGIVNDNGDVFCKFFHAVPKVY